MVSTDLNEGVVINSLFVNGESVGHSAMEYIHNDFILHLKQPLLPDEKIDLAMTWNYTINEKSHFRTGKVDSTSWFVAYFFPRIAVYDDIDGWNDFKYSGSAEFYNDYGDFNVAITVPRNFIVWATGMLQNPGEVLREKYANRYSAALTSDEIIHIVDSTECTSGQVTQPNITNTWRFKAEYVTDFAFAISDHYLWDATSLVVDENDNRRVLIDVAFNKDAGDFYNVAHVARQSIDYMSNMIPGVPFPFPNETIFNGLDAMEYPMMVNQYSSKDSVESVKITSHEIFHSYFPFYVGTNETKYAWMDEGFACLGDFLILSELLSPDVADFFYLENYRRNAGSDVDVPIFTNSRHLTRPMYHINAYAKSAVFFYILKDLLADDGFSKTLQEYIRRWNGKHPIPYDFFNTVNDMSGQNLDYLFKPWFFEFGFVDLAIKDVTATEIVIEKIGRYPAPVHLELFYKDGSTQTINKTAAVWKDGNRIFSIPVPAGGMIEKVELKHRLVPDADVSNNLFKATD